MSWFEALTLAVLQGLTEFLPVSSSGHLAVASSVFSSLSEVEARPDDGLFFIVMLHVGTLVAIVLYYARDVRSGARGVITGGGSGETPSRAVVIRSLLLAGVATLPAVVVGLTLKKVVDDAFQSVIVPGVAFLGTALLLLVTTLIKDGKKGPSRMTWQDALMIGLAQALAITPGISRSGSTIAVALALGFSRTWAVGFSLLMAVPAILGAAVLEVKDLDAGALSAEVLRMTLVATVLSGVVGYGAIVWLVRIVRSGRLWYFSVYLVVLSATVLGAAMVTGFGSGSESKGEADGQGRRAEALERPGGVDLGRSGSPRGGIGHDLARADADRPGSPGPTTGEGSVLPSPIDR